MVGMSGKDRKASIEPIKVATTLMARDYKGLNNYGFNGVLEDRSEEDRANIE